MTTDKIENIVDYDYPNIELHKDIYARLSGDEEAKGEHSSTSIAEYDENENKIFIYYPNVNNEEDVLKALIHEYTHYTQDSKLLKRYRSIYSYNEDPFELEATKAENKWQLFSKK